jgi:hypothetical protein
MGSIMTEAGSQGQGQRQDQPRRKISPLVAGLGAAAVACAVTAVIMMSNSPVATPDQAATSADQCQIQRKLLVSSTTGSGTVRLREGNYLSPPIKLSAEAKAVVFPLPRPETTPVEEVITIEGNANDVVITSDLTALRKVFNVVGASAFNVTWKPMKGC